MIRRPPRSTRTDTLFPYTTLFRSIVTRKKSVGRVALVIHERALEQDRGRCHPARRAPCDNIVIRGATFAVALPICAAVTAPPCPWPLPLERHADDRSEEHTSELQSLMRISYAVFCLKKKTNN